MPLALHLYCFFKKIIKIECQSCVPPLCVVRTCERHSQVLKENKQVNISFSAAEAMQQHICQLSFHGAKCLWFLFPV